MRSSRPSTCCRCAGAATSPRSRSSSTSRRSSPSATSDGERVFVGSSAGGVLRASTRATATILWQHEAGRRRRSARPRYVGRPRRGLRRRRRRRGLRARRRRPAPSAGSIDAQGPDRRRSRSTPTGIALLHERREPRLRARRAPAARGSGSTIARRRRASPSAATRRRWSLDGRVYVGFSDGYLACLSAAGGDVQWARSLAGDATRFMDVDSTPLVVRRHAVRLVLLGRRLRARSQGRLDPLALRRRGRAARCASRDGARVLHAPPSPGCTALDLDGHLLWRQALAEGGELSAPPLVGGYVLVSSAPRRHLRRRRAHRPPVPVLLPGPRRHRPSRPPTAARSTCSSNGGYFYALALNKL